MNIMYVVTNKKKFPDVTTIRARLVADAEIAYATTMFDEGGT